MLQESDQGDDGPRQHQTRPAGSRRRNFDHITIKIFPGSHQLLVFIRLLLQGHQPGLCELQMQVQDGYEVEQQGDGVPGHLMEAEWFKMKGGTFLDIP